MSRPPHPGETFSPSDATRTNLSTSATNGSSAREPGRSDEHVDNPDETRPRSAFGVAGSGPAGGFEPNPASSPPMPPPAPPNGGPPAMSPPDAAGFSAPTTSSFGDPSLQSDGHAPASGISADDFGPPTEYAAPPTELVSPGGFRPPGETGSPSDFRGPSEFQPPTPDFAAPNSGFGAPPGPYGESPGAGFGPPPGAFSQTLEGFNGPPSAAAGAPLSGGMGGLRPRTSPTDGGMPPPGAASRPGGPAVGAAARARGPRRARLQLRHINPWTVLKFSCVLSVALFFVWLITIGLLYGILQAAGVIDHINNAVMTINGSGSKDPVTPGLVFGGAAILGVVNIVLFIALSTVGSVVYNLCADLVGGVEVTLSERD